MRIERQMRAVDRQIVLNAQAGLLKHALRHRLQAAPEEPVMNQQQVSPARHGFANHRQAGIDGGDDFGHLAFAILHLQAIERIAVIGDLGDAKFRINIGGKFREAHGSRQRLIGMHTRGRRRPQQKSARSVPQFSVQRPPLLRLLRAFALAYANLHTR